MPFCLYSRSRRWRPRGTSELEAQSQSGTHRAPWQHGDVVRFSSLLVEKIFTVDAESHSSSDEEIGPATDSRDTVVVLPIRAELPADEILNRCVVVREGAGKSDTVVIDPVGCSRDIPRRRPATLRERRIDSKRACGDLEHSVASAKITSITLGEVANSAVHLRERRAH